MIGIILASHGQFAQGLLHSATMIFGEQQNVCAVSLLSEESPETLRMKMKQAIASMEVEEVIFLVDLWGGTPCNQAMMLVEEHKETWALVAGMNLPMLLDVLSKRSSYSTRELTKYLMKNIGKGVCVYPKELMVQKEKEKDASTKKTIHLNESGMENKKMQYVLARIDSRLLHGQVVTSWVPTTHPDRIIVVSDTVAHDKLRKKLIEQAAPSQVKVNVVPIAKMIAVADDSRFGETKAMLLFETVQDALKVIEGGVELHSLNIGSLAHSEGKAAVNKVLSLDLEDVEAFTKLKEKGVAFDVRKVPNDTAEDMEEILAKAKKLLSSNR